MPKYIPRALREKPGRAPAKPTPEAPKKETPRKETPKKETPKKGTERRRPSPRPRKPVEEKKNGARTRPGGKVVAPSRTTAKSRKKKSARKLPAAKLRRLRVMAVVLTVLALGAGGFAGYARHLDQRAAATNDARSEAKAAAVTAARALFSYDYRTFDKSVENGSTFATGDFAREYGTTTRNLKDAAVKEQAVVWAEASVAGVISASPDRVEVLLYVNQYRKNVNITGQKVDQNRVVLTMVRVKGDRVKGDWKVAKAAAL